MLLWNNLNGRYWAILGYFGLIWAFWVLIWARPNEGPIVPPEKADAAFEGGIVTQEFWGQYIQFIDSALKASLSSTKIETF